MSATRHYFVVGKVTIDDKKEITQRELEKLFHHDHTHIKVFSSFADAKKYAASLTHNKNYKCNTHLWNEDKYKKTDQGKTRPIFTIKPSLKKIKLNDDTLEGFTAELDEDLELKTVISGETTIELMCYDTSPHNYFDIVRVDFLDSDKKTFEFVNNEEEKANQKKFTLL